MAEAHEMEATWNKLLRMPEGQRLSADEVEGLVAHLARALGESLTGGVEIEHGSTAVDEGNISAVIRSRGTSGGLLALAWQARLFVALVGDGEVSISAIVFLFAGDRRLVAGSAGDYLFLRMNPAIGPGAPWEMRGWTRDEYDEWRDFDRLDG